MQEGTRLFVVNDELQKRFGKAGRELVTKEFSQERIAAETLQPWEEVLS